MASIVDGGYDAVQRQAVKPWQMESADRVLRLGRDMVLEFGFFRREERDEARELAAKAGAEAEPIFLGPPFEELVHRIEARNRDLPPDTFPGTREHLELCVTWVERPGKDEVVSVYL